MLMTRRHIHKKKVIVTRWRKESAEAFSLALPRMILDGGDVPGSVARAVEAQLAGTGADLSKLEAGDLEVLSKTMKEWRYKAEAWRLARIDRLIAEKEAYPVDSRVLPTKLGNLLRATEDKLQHTGGDVRGFVLRRRGLVSPRIQVQHDQFRTRLDMYCTLVFVSAFLAVIAPLALVGRTGIIPITITAGSFIMMSVASYLAAIASADGYCSALRQMDEAAQVSTGG